MKDFRIDSEDSLTLKSGNCCDTSYYSTECPNCGALFHTDESKEPKLVTAKEILDNLLIKELVRCRVSILHRNIKTHTYYCVSTSNPIDVHVSVPKKLFKRSEHGVQDVEVIGITKIGLMRVPSEAPAHFQRTERYIIIRAKSIKSILDRLRKHECPQCGWGGELDARES